MSTLENRRLQGILKILVREKLLNEEKALYYQQIALSSRVNLQDYLVANQLLSALAIAEALAQNFGLPILDLDTIPLESIPVSLIGDTLIRHHHVVPLYQRNKQLYLATSDPSQHLSLQEIQFHTGLQPHFIVVETDKLNNLIEKLLHQQETQGLSDYFTKTEPHNTIEFSFEDDHYETESNDGENEDGPIVKFVNRILLTAIKKGVSDIHFEPYEQEYRIRYRQDGLLNKIADLPVRLSNRIAARIKIMANLDISEKRIPQDGRFKMKLSTTQSIDCRISSCPTVAGEKMVVRILDPSSAKLDIDSLGFSLAQKNHFLNAIQRPQGMILVTGPTGSGKTVTLYTALNKLNTIDKNISTAEDPVEMKVPGINQVNIQPKTGLTFSRVLRSFLRQDPDIIMVGEIRDTETAEIAIKAAQTGHLVLSTLHTNSAAETLTRFINMGVQSFNIASAVSLIIAQRLVRRLCEHCKVISDDSTATLLLYKATGCNQCVNGYRGRIGLFEVMPMSKNIDRIIMSGGTSLDILQQAEKEGMLTIYQAGLEKIREGLTTEEEVNRVTVD